MIIQKPSISRKIFVILNYVFLTLSAVICIIPFLHIVAVSFSSKTAVSAGWVTFWPINFQLDTYNFVVKSSAFYTAFGKSIERTILGVIIDMLFTILAAYPLSRRKNQFHARGFYAWFFVVTMLFGGGLIPTYLVVQRTGLIDTIWALIIPGAVPVFNVILLQNFFKELPDEISESAFIDGAGHWTVLTKILVPISKPVMATLILFVAVTHWNSWFDGLIYMNHTDNYPLQSYLQTIIVKVNLEAAQNINDIANISQQNVKSAQIIIAMLPILCVYPFLQKYFTKGIVLGSVKG